MKHCKTVGSSYEITERKIKNKNKKSMSIIFIISFGILALFVSYYSFRGGVWLWLQIGTSIPFSILQLKRGAMILFLALCLLLVGLCFLLLDAARSKDEMIYHASMALAYTLAYNSGYLFSIWPSRRSLGKYQGIAGTGFFATCWAVAAPALVFASSAKFENSLLIYFVLSALLFYASGFFLWEQFRQSKAFYDSGFANLLWYLSVGFVAISALVMFSGIAVQLSMLSAFIPLGCILLLIISLIAYLAGLLKVLVQT